jgi:hypothetical protein
MHKQVSSLLANGGSPGQLAKYAHALADAGVNIRAIGGSEWEHRGAVAVLVDDSTDEEELLKALGDEFPSRWLYCAEAVLPDEPGSLATAADRIGDKLNILSVLVADTHLGVGLVSFGFETEREAEAARANLGNYAVEEVHDLTRAWAEHEAWDQSNPDKPDPRHPSP